jgi:hypothetical protein
MKASNSLTSPQGPSVESLPPIAIRRALSICVEHSRRRAGVHIPAEDQSMAVKRYKVSNRLLITGKDAPADLDLRNVYVVLADDYDALAAELAEAQRMIAVWEGKWRDCEVKFQNTQSYGVTAQAAHLARIRDLEAERDSLQEDVIEVTTRMATAEAIIHAIDFRLGRDGWTLELAQALGYSQSDRGDKQ